MRHLDQLRLEGQVTIKNNIDIDQPRAPSQRIGPVASHACLNRKAPPHQVFRLEGRFHTHRAIDKIILRHRPHRLCAIKRRHRHHLDARLSTETAHGFRKVRRTISDIAAEA